MTKTVEEVGVHSVRLAHITKRFGSFTAVNDVSLDIKRGELLTLLGPSGCGKTTTLRTIAGLEKPAAGTVHLDGRDVTDVPANLRPVNTVFQSYALFPHLDVFENVAFGLRRRHRANGEIKTKVVAQLTMMGLASYETKRPHELSGGEQQRVALARALVLEPSVLLLDEPFASLDFKLRQRLQIELKSLQRETGISFVMVTHDQNEAMAMSDRIAVMNKGRIEQLGDPIDIYERPLTPFVAGFIGDANFLDTKLSGRSGGQAVVHAPGRGELAGESLIEGDLGCPARLFVRPEDVRLGQPGEGENSVEGTVETTVIVGGLDRKVLVRLDEGTIIESLVRSGAVRDIRSGERTVVSWPVAKSRVFAGATS